MLQHLPEIEQAPPRTLFENENVVVPPMVIFSPSIRYNLSCNGCYSRDYPADREMDLDEIDRFLLESEALGVEFMVVAGEEPLMRKGRSSTNDGIEPKFTTQTGRLIKMALMKFIENR